MMIISATSLLIRKTSMTPIIVPITNTQVKNCIVQAGVRYCEDQPTTKKDISYLSFGLVGLFIWFAFSFWFGMKIGEKTNTFELFWILGIGFVIPALIIGLISLF